MPIKIGDAFLRIFQAIPRNTRKVLNLIIYCGITVQLVFFNDRMLSLIQRFAAKYNMFAGMVYFNNSDPKMGLSKFSSLCMATNRL